MIGTLVVEDDMHFPGAWATNVRTKHNSVRGIAIHLGLVQITREKLDVTASTIDILLMFDTKLDN